MLMPVGNRQHRDSDMKIRIMLTGSPETTDLLHQVLDLLQVAIDAGSVEGRLPLLVPLVPLRMRGQSEN